MSAHEVPAPVERKLLTPGVWVLVVIAAVGLVCGVYRFFWGLRASTNLDQQYPWGIWIVADVSFIALAAGGFVTAAVAHIFHRHAIHSLARPALITALLGYTFACVALAADLGRYYNIWHPILPIMWQGNSALFEVGMCVMCYLTVLYIEFVPVFCERFLNATRYPRFARLCSMVHWFMEKVMFVFIILGVGISCLHQSSLGHVMALAPTKLHPLWYSPMLALLFLISAIAGGFPTVIFACLYGSWALRLKAPMRALSSLAKYVPFLLGVYLTLKMGEMLVRGSYVYLTEGSRQSRMFILEMGLGVVVPLVLFLFRRVRETPFLLGLASFLAMFGVVLNRANAYWVGYRPPYTDKVYFPSLAEWGLTIGIVATLLLCWRVLATYFPVISRPSKLEMA